jgi:hypothetical protein
MLCCPEPAGVGCLSEQQQEVTGVAMGNGMSSCGEVAETWDLLVSEGVRHERVDILCLCFVTVSAPHTCHRLLSVDALMLMLALMFLQLLLFRACRPRGACGESPLSSCLAYCPTWQQVQWVSGEGTSNE